jgi:hypothetical protein
MHKASPTKCNFDVKTTHSQHAGNMAEIPRLNAPLFRWTDGYIYGRITEGEVMENIFGGKLCKNY